MSSKDKETPSGEEETAAPETPKRPARTIDLEAEEVKVEQDDAASPDDDPADVRSPEGDEADDEAASTETPGRAGTVPDHKPAAESDEQGKPPPPPQRTKPSDVRSFFTHLAAGLVGGLIGVVGAGVGLDRLSVAGLTGGPSGSEKSAQIEERLDEVAAVVQEQSKKISTLPGGAPIEEIRKRLAAIEARPETDTAASAALGERLGKLEESIKAIDLSAGNANAGGGEQASALIARVDKLETALEARAAALEEELAKAQSAVAQAASRSAVSGAEKEALSVVEQRLETLEGKLGQIASRPAGTGDNAAASGGKRAGLALAFQSMRRAAERGEAFKTQLDTLKGLAGDDIDTSKLFAMAAKGIPARRDLLGELPGHLQAARAAALQSSDETILGRLAANAQSIVRIHKVGPAEGTTTPAILSRMEAAAAAGNMDAAVSEAAGLKGAPADTVGPWVEKAKQRLALDAALDQLETRLLAAVSQNGAKPG